MKTTKASLPLIVLSAAGLTACGQATGADETVDTVRPVKTLVVGARDQANTRMLPGTVQAASAVDLSFRVGGPLVALAVDEGQAVKKGQVLARIDPRDYRVRVRSIEARLGAARAQLTHAEINHTRAERLAAKDALPKARLDDASAALDVTRAEVTAAERALEAAKLALSDSTLRAPFAGRVSRRRVENHQTVAPGQPILLLQRTDAPEVHVDLSESALADFLAAPADALTVRFPRLGDTVYPVRVTSRQADADRQTRTYEVVLAVEGDVAGLEPGMTAEVQWRRTSARRTLVVPLAAVGRSPDGQPVVYRLVDGHLERQAVTLGPVSDEGVVLKAGVSPGDVLLAAGVQAALPGQSVRPLAAEDLGG